MFQRWAREEYVPVQARISYNHLPKTYEDGKFLPTCLLEIRIATQHMGRSYPDMLLVTCFKAVEIFQPKLPPKRVSTELIAKAFIVPSRTADS